ncbi:MAG: Alkanal monooxygenase beta chain [Paracidovorax wautersii]|uniref:Alkanal monooxygenase beta chain n=1 Tax=Paracidovorax wautersii TaxID=1177982 RepID=A0A7V8JRI4_9BURK|nr:MAG: Alkanal monooxygenase beta chain [Paracidovorax wautersii]
MGYTLSLLDKSPLGSGETATQALARSVELARLAEQSGYHRYWVAEHHNSAHLACPSPEILIAHILAHTTRIRVGSGGVMLQHYSPYKVAENFNLLAALAPGRVDLGVGKAPGGLPLSTRALQAWQDPARKPPFDEQLAELARHLAAPAADDSRDSPEGGGASDESENAFGAVLRTTPQPPAPAQPFLLGASIASAELAARLGWPLVYAAHINGAAAEVARVLDHYRQLTGRPALLAVSAIVSEDAADAAQLAARQQRFRVRVGDGQPVNVGSIEQAEAYVRQAGGGEYQIEQREAHVLHGRGADVVKALDALHQRHGIEEFVIDQPLAEGAARLASVRLLAQAHRAAVV